ncbi:MAG: DUF5685 family protein, partial [Oscillospiraceae bacterium]
YRAYYCGICRSLRENHGIGSGLIVSYDMTFLVMLLTSLYEPETGTGNERCSVHPVKPHDYISNCFTDYAADMSVLLAYHKALDDWRDEKRLSAKTLSSFIRSTYEKTAEQYTRQTHAIEKCMSKLQELEDIGVCDPDAAAKCFGDLMREIFICREDNWAKLLGEMADALGRFIYILDAFVDLKGDIKHNRYNPLCDMRRRGCTDKDIQDVLTMLIGECAINFEKLPLIQDVDIMRNILYSGVWTKFPLGLTKTKGNGGEIADDK